MNVKHIAVLVLVFFLIGCSQLNEPVLVEQDSMPQGCDESTINLEHKEKIENDIAFVKQKVETLLADDFKINYCSTFGTSTPCDIKFNIVRKNGRITKTTEEHSISRTEAGTKVLSEEELRNLEEAYEKVCKDCEITGICYATPTKYDSYRTPQFTTKRCYRKTGMSGFCFNEDGLNINSYSGRGGHGEHNRDIISYSIG
jgi:hypothetical protein